MKYDEYIEKRTPEITSLILSNAPSVPSVEVSQDFATTLVEFARHVAAAEYEAATAPGKFIKQVDDLKSRFNPPVVTANSALDKAVDDASRMADKTTAEDPADKAVDGASRIVEGPADNANEQPSDGDSVKDNPHG